MLLVHFVECIILNLTVHLIYIYKQMYFIFNELNESKQEIVKKVAFIWLARRLYKILVVLC